MISKKNIFIVVVLLCNIFAFYCLYKSIPKIGFVRSKVLIEKYEGVKESRALYNKKLMEWQKVVDTTNDMLEREINLFEKGKSSLPPSIQAFREHQLEEKVDAFKRFKAETEEKAQAEEEKLSQAVFNQINSMVEQYAKDHHYDIIMGTTKEGSLMYGDDTKDITDEVLVELNKKYKGE